MEEPANKESAESAESLRNSPESSGGAESHEGADDRDGVESIEGTQSLDSSETGERNIDAEDGKGAEIGEGDDSAVSNEIKGDAERLGSGEDDEAVESGKSDEGAQGDEGGEGGNSAVSNEIKGDAERLESGEDDEAVESGESDEGAQGDEGAEGGQEVRGRIGRYTRQWPWLPVAIGALLFLAIVWLWGQSSPAQVEAIFDSLVDIDLSQERIDTALPLPRGAVVVSQSFTPRHDGLQEIEVTLARYGEAATDEDGRLTLQLQDQHGAVLAEQTLETSTLEHNQEYRFAFPPQPNSAGQRYILTLRGNASNMMSVWGYSLDVYGGGGITVGGAVPPDSTATPAQDLRFITRYRLGMLDALRSLAETFYFEGVVFLVALLVVPLPGCLLLFLLHRRLRTVAADRPATKDLIWPWDPAAWWGAALGLGMAAWPLIWLWFSTIGGHFTAVLLWLVVVGGWAAFAALWWRDRAMRRRRIAESPDIRDIVPHPPLTLAWEKEHMLLLLILALSLAVRFLAVRDVIFPPWVDSSRHALITAVMVDSGQVIKDYTPYLPVERFPYHFGFHTLASTLAIMSDWPLNRLLLTFGQLLNAFVPLAIYAAIWLVSRRRDAGLVGAFLVAVPFFFPAYYATWGRLTQLAAVYLLPLLLALTWQLVRGKASWQRVWWLVSILAAGLFLTHFRVFVYYLPFAFLVWLLSKGRRGRWLAAAAGSAAVLILPRLVQLIRDTDPLQRVGQTIPGYNNFPTNYFNAGWEEIFVYLAAGGAVVAIVAALRGRRWAILPLFLLIWVAALFLLLSFDRIGLSVPSLVNLNSMYIILFVPTAMFLALLSIPLWDWLAQQMWLVRAAGLLLVGAALGAMLLFGVRQQINILNRQTILAYPEDYIALNWVDENLPEDAVVAVNSWRWLGETWAAADGGAWLLPLTGRTVTTPPIDHIYNRALFNEVREFNQAAADVADWSDPAQVDWLREQGVTHIYVGKKGGFFDPAVLARNQGLEQQYGRHGVYVFALAE